MNDLFTQPPLEPGVRDTSVDSYHEHRDSGKLGKQQQRIVTYMRACPGGYTRSELAAVMGARLSSVCGRINELIKRGIVHDAPRRTCRITGKNAHEISLSNG